MHNKKQRKKVSKQIEDLKNILAKAKSEPTSKNGEQIDEWTRDL